MTRNKVTKFLLAGIAGFALLPIDGHGAANAIDRRAAEAEAKMTAGEELSERGQFEDAIARWREAERAFAKAKDVDGEMRARLREAAACQSLGQHRLALQALNSADKLAGDNPRREAEAKAARGAICTFAREADQAEPLLRESLKTARAEKDKALVATILNDL
ncbi:MAG TPA: hypothetical protein VEO95_12750, partial [Chthoniobacteraceae bacterium]|nr:hypothetical protein [Chthoniobacteraceae bacterium]